MIDPRNHYAFKHKGKRALELLIENKRNEAIQSNLLAYIKNNEKKEYRMDIGVVFGDEHMPFVYEILLDQGFLWSLQEKIQVF